MKHFQTLLSNLTCAVTAWKKLSTEELRDAVDAARAAGSDIAPATKGMIRHDLLAMLTTAPAATPAATVGRCMLTVSQPVLNLVSIYGCSVAALEATI